MQMDNARKTQRQREPDVVPTAIVTQQPLPDGIAFSTARQRVYWTAMGTLGANNGSIWSCRPDGSDVRAVVRVGEAQLHTPKQIVVDDVHGQLYWADREGMRIMRCSLDRENNESHESGKKEEEEEEEEYPIETLIQTGVWQDETHCQDATRWCVGVALSLRYGKLFWTQKGPPRGVTGKVLCADLACPEQTVVVLADQLPEPIDLHWDEKREILYWTDRGELPWGNSLNALDLHDWLAGTTTSSSSSSPSVSSSLPPPRLLSRNFHDPIGLSVDTAGEWVYVADLGGSLYRCHITSGEKEKLYQDEGCAFAGITHAAIE
ncbi:hypothetical protein ASPZODRAFT_160231 [Penicilliopsis zonata CBS 506.65]|uniref:SMP-30/Gluconolactonase/LRE-like region domain-containing protein n=1 Tax=Penicilliopsis zonata CBS 506.65 TaxID=1073090 RepID=A0A1L9SDU4_9EURO|nr:hypothetical protein ASPZODRAFT_160231 [Penicilliopsis zonata CBS 506.65]OJJ45349.1 hypothetical protein ASPZODRAFT_160231 [Penicilliopsis zonata CBS 506.65]